jgi:hypothetical protein
VISISVAAIFLVVAITLCLYDSYVQGRNAIVIEAAVRSHAILNNLFPKNVRERLIREMEEGEKAKKTNKTAKSHLNEFLQTNERSHQAHDTQASHAEERPIAEL